MKINYKNILLEKLGNGNFLYHIYKRDIINKISTISNLLKCKYEISEDTWNLLSECNYHAMTFTGKFIKRSGKLYDFSLYVDDYVCHATGYLDINGIRMIDFTKDTIVWDPGLYSHKYYIKVNDEINNIFYKRK